MIIMCTKTLVSEGAMTRCEELQRCRPLTNDQGGGQVEARVLSHLMVVRAQGQNHRVVQAANGASYAVPAVSVA